MAARPASSLMRVAVPPVSAKKNPPNGPRLKSFGSCVSLSMWMYTVMPGIIFEAAPSVPLLPSAKITTSTLGGRFGLKLSGMVVLTVAEFPSPVFRALASLVAASAVPTIKIFISRLSFVRVEHHLG